MEISSGEFDLPQKDLIDREEAIRALNDEGEHKFLFEKGKGPVFIVGTSLENLQRDNIEPRLHEQILQSLVKEGLITNAEETKGGYCRVDEGELLFWGPSSYPVVAAEEETFNGAIGTRRIKIIDQWVGEKPANAS